MILGARKDGYLVGIPVQKIPYGDSEEDVERQKMIVKRTIKILVYFCDKTGINLLQSVLNELVEKGKISSEISEVEGQPVVTIKEVRDNGVIM